MTLFMSPRYYLDCPHQPQCHNKELYHNCPIVTIHWIFIHTCGAVCRKTKTVTKYFGVWRIDCNCQIHDPRTVWGCVLISNFWWLYSCRYWKITTSWPLNWPIGTRPHYLRRFKIWQLLTGNRWRMTGGGTDGGYLARSAAQKPLHGSPPNLQNLELRV